MEFAHLHVHSRYTFMRGTGSPEELVLRAKELGYSHLALTDTHGLWGLPLFLDAAKRHQIVPIVGAHVLGPDAEAVILAKNDRGYTRITGLLTGLHRDKEGFSLTRELSRGFPGCVVLSPDVELLSALGPRPGLFAELLAGDRSRATINAARYLSIPAVATGGVYLLGPGDFELHRALRAMDLNTTLDRVPAGELAPRGAWLKRADEIALSFPYAADAVERAASLARSLAFDWGVRREVFPRWPGEEESFETLRRLCIKGMERRYRRPLRKVLARLESELALIREKGFADYFLVVADIVARFPITCGRGSAAASLVSYLLGITHVDPIRHNLMFSRFLNEGREDLPDIDVDFPWDERASVLGYVRARFGEENVAAVANHVGFRARGALREAAKVFGIPPAEIKEVTRRLSGYTGPSSIRARMDEHPLFRGIELPDPWPEILAISSRLRGFVRHMSTHCGGVVVTPDKVSSYVPVQVSPKGVDLIQWDKDGAEARGLVKIDLLGNRTLAVIRDTLAALRENPGIDIPYSRLDPLHDNKTRALVKEGCTMGVFYVESPAMRRLLAMCQSGDYEQLVILSSIIRPAANRFILEYVRRLRGGSWAPLHPKVEEILAETLGIMVYQEDIARVAVEAAGFSEQDADIFRKILSKKSRRKVGEQKEKFYRGAAQRGFSPKVIDALWDMISSFAGYSFCKPHSASYALVSFKAAFLKAHFPAQFMAAVIANRGGYYHPRAYLSEAERMGLKVLGPDVNESHEEYTGKEGAVRVGLSQIKGLSVKCLEKILRERKRERFRDFANFMARVGPGLSDGLLLLKAGALDSIGKGPGRVGMAWWLRTDADAGSLPLKSAPNLPRGDLPAALKLSQEVETLGFPVSCHPLETSGGIRSILNIRCLRIKGYKNFCLNSNSLNSIVSR